jgi:acyl-coenzyme A synthetase/AMP-(fatty) acid ligase
MRPSERKTLSDWMRRSGHLSDRFLWGRSESVALATVADSACIADVSAFEHRSVLLLTRHPLSAARALADLDGVARQIIICPPGIADEQLEWLGEAGCFDAAVVDHERPAVSRAAVVARIEPGAAAAAWRPAARSPAVGSDTDWVMFTSGTTGAPKLVVHTLEGLAGAIDSRAVDGDARIWGTFYDVRRYGGLQILLRALLGGASLVFAEPGEDMADFLGRLAQRGATHVTGTPSHWRTALMHAGIEAIRPRYIRLSGEIADQPMLSALRTRFPGADIVQAYASTEAGVGFEVDDGLEGFPASILEREGPVEIRVRNDVLQVRSERTARRYLNGSLPLMDAEGFVDTGDVVECRGDRCFFVGRRGGIINVGGLKVHPEEVEAVINSHSEVMISRVKGRRNPISGMVVVAEIVPVDALDPSDEARVRSEVFSTCDRHLERYKIPMRITFVPTLPMTPGGKLARDEPAVASARAG